MSCNAVFKAWRLPLRGGVFAFGLLCLGVSAPAASASGTLQPIETQNTVSLEFTPPAPGS